MLVRLTAEDRLLLDARAEARGMRPATYASVLLRSHLRQLSPLPKDELLALKRSITELGSIGRNINQIAKAVSGGGEVPGSLRCEFWAMLKICTALRDNTKALLEADRARLRAFYSADRFFPHGRAGDLQCSVQGPRGPSQNSNRRVDHIRYRQEIRMAHRG
jgi:hypothetical protein